jgi:hypothetical protein
MWYSPLRPFGPNWAFGQKPWRPVSLPDGRFELHGCDPEKTYRLSFLEAPAEQWRGLGNLHHTAKDAAVELAEIVAPRLLESSSSRRGATVELRAPLNGRPVTVRLGACGSAQVRLVDGAGKAVKDYPVWLEHVLSPGPAPQRALRERKLAGEALLVGAGMHLVKGDTPLRADDDGRITFPTLIPGATYRLVVTSPRQPFSNALHEQEFRVEAGQRLQLGEVRLPALK